MNKKDLLEYLEEAPIKDLQELKKQVDESCKKIDDFTEYYKSKHKKLCEAIKDPLSYVYNIQERIKEEEQALLDQLDKKIELSKKIKSL